ncbi:competence type IV pilus minor pilin ComGF [Fervidibacillus halotolerans]|uniref:Competence type IV pilus minor pilin ComGF n=1 Tax=Fervidibacillus halotolerans TaxID=2980027 RepID=A0A9E8RW72_9BACI|nr:competence type IV pilus minor pilin ComGF [Fervidibacillus halotolerans]WAA11445.1 competence type IV pilus minor pilin ComGF [Fervidibacillus halotolerans]
MFVGRFKDDKGFTLLELFFSLFIFSLILIFISHTVPLLQYHDYTEEFLNEMEWEVFVNQVKSEIRNSDKIRLTYNRILLYEDEKLILYEKYGNQLRRRVDLKGHEIILFSIASFSYQKTTKGITIQVERKDGTVHEATIFIPPHIEVEE